MRCLQAHLAAAAIDVLVSRSERTENDCGEGELSIKEKIFNKIVGLRVGEALLFAPNGMVRLDLKGYPQRLDARYLKVNIRSRLTSDGGKSVMAD
jgi:hypothetical protein